MIHFSNVSKNYGSQVLYANASFQIQPADRIGLVGPNGAGKTTVFRILSREEDADSGEVSIPGRTIVGYFSQTVGDMRGRSALDEVKAASGSLQALSEELAKLEIRLENSTNESPDGMTALLERYGEVQQEFERRGGYDLEHRAQAILTGLGIGPDDYCRPVESFSGGWKMRIALAKILLLNPDVLLMDEPTNYLDVESIIWLEEWLSDFKGSLVMTSHDRDFLNRSVKKIVEVANKTITTYSGNYDFYERERDLRREQLISAHKRQQDMLAKEEEFIARFAARASHAAQVNSRVKKIDKIERIEIPAEDKVVKFEFSKSPRSGDDVVIAENLAKVWNRDDGKNKQIFGGVSVTVKRKSKVAVVGVNGAGKSTLLKVIAGQTDATSGMCRLGASVELGYFSQHALEVLDGNKTIYEELSSHLPKASVGYVKNLLGSFLFSAEEVDKKISVLSGGEKSRVVLATILAKPVNLLILDEPTNHLDIKSREVLLNAIQEFEGTVMLVSHDRFFLRSIVDRVLEVDRGHVSIYEGNYEYYLEKKAKLAAESK